MNYYDIKLARNKNEKFNDELLTYENKTEKNQISCKHQGN